MQNKWLSPCQKFQHARKIVAFVVKCLLNFVLLVYFCLCFVRAKSFCKEKINRLEIVPITSFYYTTDVYPYQPAYREFICTHLFLFVIICDFLSLYENKQAYEYHHLKQIFYHQNMILIFSRFRMFPFYVFCLKFFSFYV